MSRCSECGNNSGNWNYKFTKRQYVGDGYNFSLTVKLPYCDKCGSLIYDKSIEEEIQREANYIIRKQKDIITKDEILQLLEKYDISQKYLSKILGWGEVTLPRYISGNYTPNSENNLKLKSIENPYVFLSLVQNSNALNDNLYDKTVHNIGRVILENESIKGKIFSVVNWFLENEDSDNVLTHLALQKALYFSQAWSYVINGTWLFNDDCEAWVHGAVYREIFQEFKSFGGSYLPVLNIQSILSEEDKSILRFVKQYYLDVYTAKTLEKICHLEEPYKQARAKLNDDEPSQEVISKETILTYYSRIAGKYNIDKDNLSNVKGYLNCVLNAV